MGFADLFGLGAFLFFLALGFGIGTWRERSHLASLTRRESKSTDIGVANLRAVTQPETVEHAELVMGQAVIANDYFKTVAASLRNIVGGEMKSLETLMTRARREATLRMLESARALGATEVWNVRYDTSNITSGNSKNPAASVEVLASGTAIRRKSTH
ncbi:MAG: heavy metal-binding domain-containing protein [Phycisphaerales bacterium]|nr:heavy metal-binding domain-containing protein [Phycisphaerales bacterium]